LRRTIPRLLVAVLVFGTAAFSYAHRAELQPVNIQALLAGNPWAPVLFVAIHVVVSLSFIPRTILAVAAGAIFGLWAGIVLTMIGGMVGGAAGFLLARYLHRGFFAFDGKRGLAWVTALRRRLDDGGWRGVALVRLVPVLPHTAGNYAFGLTQVSFVDFCLGSFIGLLPTTVLAVDFGAAGGQVLNGSIGWVEPTLVGLAAVAATIILPRLLKALSRRRK
jgi:uncharacterized membrane protein YdjX (TVP38/TMEM64 family)